MATGPSETFPVRSASVALVGFGDVGRAAMEALLSLGVRSLHVADDSAQSTQREGSWADGGSGATVRLHPYPRPGTEWSTPWLSDCDLCLLCADQVDPAVAAEVNASCLEHRVPMLPGLVMGTVAQVGPVMALGKSACLQCVDLRLRAVTGRSCLAAFGPGPSHLARAVGRELADRAGRVLGGRGGALGRELTYYWADGSSRDHPILRTWHCPQCRELESLGPSRERAPSAGPGSPSADGVDILRLEDALVDPVTGPIRSLERFEPGGGDPPLRHWVATLADPGWASFGTPELYCGGNSLEEEEARAAALGEAVERMSVCHPLPSQLLVAAHGDLGEDAVDPGRWDLFAPETRALPGFPYVAVTSREPLTWVWGWSLTSDKAVLVPAGRVFVPFRARTPADRADYPTLSGSASAGRWQEAVLAGLLEIAERDAFMIGWANRLPLPGITLDPSSPAGVGAYVAAFADAGVEVRCSLVTLDLGIPVVIAMARGRGPDEPAVVVAAAAAPQPAQACRHALRELAANRLNVRQAMSTATGLPECDPLAVRDERAHGLLYAHPDMAEHLRHWWDPPSMVPLTASTSPGATVDDLQRLVAGLSAAGLEVIAVDVTPPEIRDLGLFVAKVLVPGTYPMNFDSAWPQLGGRRLRSAPVSAGLLDSPLSFDELNRVPHPFP